MQFYNRNNTKSTLSNNSTNDKDDMSIFDGPIRVDTVIPPSNENKRSNNQNDSQVIINDSSEDESQMDVDVITESTSQIIEDTQDTLNQYVGDVCILEHTLSFQFAIIDI